jgi:hypothetical protein
MATINTNNSANPQLTGILNTTPMPIATPVPNASVNVGASDGGGFSINMPATAPGSGSAGMIGGTGTTPNIGVAGGGQVVVGGAGTTPTAGTTPATGAQPPAPGTGTAFPGVVNPGITTGETATTTTPATTETQAAPENGSPLANAISGFGKANRGEPIKASIDGATFGFPSFRASGRTNTAPAINWGPGWKKVEKDGMWYMEHPNGSKAVPAVEFRITPKPADKVQTIKVTNGWGKKFPDGSILVFDRKEGAYRLDPKGNKHKVPFGNITIGGVKVRVFEASVVRTLDVNGKVDVFDSRGNVSKGSSRWNMAEAVGSASAGAAIGGGKGGVEGGGAPGKTVGNGDQSVRLTQDIQKLTGIAREIIGEIRSGNVDPARLAALQAQLATLPSGILQAAGAAGTMTSDGTTVSQPPATETAATAGGGGAAPIAGVDANATTKELAAGESVKIDPAAIPVDLRGKQARFAQLPEAVQQAVATGFGSDQGAGAFAPDRLIAFNADGTVRVVDKGIVFTHHQAQVRGAGPGEDRALTMRPGRQPGAAAATRHGAATATAAQASGGGAASHADHAAPSGAAAGAATVSSGSSAAKKIELFAPGAEVRHEDLGGINGTFTWKSLPARARAVISELLRSGSADPAAKAFASRTGTGWAIDPNATIVVDAGFATFPTGLGMSRSAVAATSVPPVGVPRPTPAGGGASAPEAHDATRPPVSGGGGAAAAPSAAPPIPAIADPGEGGGVDPHAGHAGH